MKTNNEIMRLGLITAFLAVICFSRLTLATEVIVDNGDTGTQELGTWILSSGANPWNESSLYSNTVATYTYSANVTGDQEISLWWTNYHNRCTDVQIDIYDDTTKIGRVQINHKADAAKWNSIGVFTINTGPAYVVINSQGSCTTCADAVKFTSSGGGTTTSLDDIPSRIAGDPGVVSGDWGPIPYTDASNATDGDYSTFASGIVTGISSIDEGFVTWDLGLVYDVIVSIKVDIIGDGWKQMHIERSVDNISWGRSVTISHDVPSYGNEISIPMRTRYIRFNCWADDTPNPIAVPGEYRIYEIKVR